MDSTARLILRGCMLCAIALATLFVPRAEAVYDGPISVTAYRLRGAPHPSAMCNPVHCTVGQANEAAGYPATVQNEFLCYLLEGTTWHALTDAYLQEVQGDITLRVCQDNGEQIFMLSAAPFEVLESCPEGMSMDLGPPKRCVSPCFHEMNKIFSANVPITSEDQTVAKACLHLSHVLPSGRNCEVVPASVTNFTYGSQLYRSGTWTPTGTACDERDPPVTTHATHTFAAVAGLDFVDKITLGNIRTNTGAGGALETQLKAIRDAVAPVTSGTASAIDCNQSWTCSGDPARCAELTFARSQYCHSIPRDDAKAETALALFDALSVKTDAELRTDLKGSQVDLGAAMNRPRMLTETGCPLPESVNLAFGPIQKSFTVNFTPLCDLAGLVRFFLLFGSSLAAIRIFIGGFS